jgi:hypothetical protein
MQAWFKDSIEQPERSRAPQMNIDCIELGTFTLLGHFGDHTTAIPRSPSSHAGGMSETTVLPGWSHHPRLYSFPTEIYRLLVCKSTICFPILLWLIASGSYYKGGLLFNIRKQSSIRSLLIPAGLTRSPHLNLCVSSRLVSIPLCQSLHEFFESLPLSRTNGRAQAMSMVSGQG